MCEGMGESFSTASAVVFYECDMYIFLFYMLSVNLCNTMKDEMSKINGQYNFPNVFFLCHPIIE